MPPTSPLLLALLCSSSSPARDMTAVRWDEGNGPHPSYLYDRVNTQLAADLERDGFTVDVGTTALDPAALDDLGVLVLTALASYYYAYDATEAEAIGAFVEAGGGLLILCDAPGTSVANLGQVLAHFGASCAVTSSTGAGFAILDEHPTMAGVRALTAATAGTVEPGEQLRGVAFDTADKGFVAVGAFGAGRVMITGDTNMLSDSYLDEDDNRLFAATAFRWLSRDQGAESDLDLDGVADDLDCEPEDPTVYPANHEVCDERDNDCDGLADDDDPDLLLSTASPWFPDEDGDGYGGAVVMACAAPANASEVGTDCDDTDPSIHPEAEDLPDDGVDQDCDGVDAHAEADTDGGAEDTAPQDTAPQDTGPGDSGSAQAPPAEDGGCGPGCAAAPTGGALLAWSAVVALLRRRGEGRSRR